MDRKKSGSNGRSTALSEGCENNDWLGDYFFREFRDTLWLRYLGRYRKHHVK